MSNLDTHILLKVYVNGNENDPSFKNKYYEHIVKHNDKVFSSENKYPDAGFDLLNPTSKLYKVGRPAKYDLGVMCSAWIFDAHTNRAVRPTGFFLTPRSSISKSNLRLSNSIGIIDSGYRGNLMCAFDCFYDDFTIEPMTRLMQVVSPAMLPILVEMVDTPDKLGEVTARGEGGFGSTGS